MGSYAAASRVHYRGFFLCIVPKLFGQYPSAMLAIHYFLVYVLHLLQFYPRKERRESAGDASTVAGFNSIPHLNRQRVEVPLQQN